MPITIQMPKLGHTMTEGTVLHWHKRLGDTVREGEVVLTVETDKAEVEIESPGSGTMARLSAEEGAVVPVGGELALLTQGGEAVPERVEAASSSREAAASPEAA